jgi:hypothetical protein
MNAWTDNGTGARQLVTPLHRLIAYEARGAWQWCIFLPGGDAIQLCGSAASQALAETAAVETAREYLRSELASLEGA